MSKLKLGLASIVAAGFVVGGLPYITKSSIDSIISEKKNELIDKGLDLKVTNHKGYFESQRDIEIKFTNTVKLLDYISNETQIDLETLNSLTKNGMIFNEISFKGTVNNSNLFPSKVKVELILDQLPEDLQNTMSENIHLKNFIKELQLNAHFNTEGQLIYVSLNDLVIQDKDIVAKILKPEMKIENNIYETSIQNITFNLSKASEYLLVYFDGIKDKLIYTDDFNFEEKAKIETIKLHLKQQQRTSIEDLKYESSQNFLNTTMATKDNQVSINTDYIFNDITLDAKSLHTKIDKFALGINMTNISEQPLRILSDSFSDDYKLQQNLEPKLQEIINNGFSINLNSHIKNIKNNNLSAKDISIDLNMDIKKNDISKYANNAYILQYIDINGKISLDNQTVTQLSQTLPIGRYNTNVQKDKSIFDIKLEKNSFYINGKKL